mmetsp:Transcript_58214/g.131878  ORF Transcript_58214/g.131878 Transcript_58214/m.131878 type:complete len:441 (+) Transcript_58214:158-1480(+)
MTKLAEWFNKIGPGLSNWPLSLVCFSSFVFSTQALCVKLLGLSGVGAFETMFVRGLCQTFGCVCTLLIWGLPPIEWLGETRTEKGLLALRGMFGFGGMGFAFLAIQTTTLANAQVASQTTPVWTALLSCLLLGEKWETPEMFTALATSIGVLLVFKPSLISSHEIKNLETFDERSQTLRNDALGVSFSLIGSFCAACVFCLIRLMGTTVKVPWPKLMLAQAAGQIFMSVPALFVSKQVLVNPNGLQILLLVGGGFIGFIGQSANTVGMQRAKAATSSLMRQTGIVTVLLYEVLLVKSETLTTATCLGAVIITTAIACLAYSKSLREGTEHAYNQARPNGSTKIKSADLAPLSGHCIDEEASDVEPLLMQASLSAASLCVEERSGEAPESFDGCNEPKNDQHAPEKDQNDPKWPLQNLLIEASHKNKPRGPQTPLACPMSV